MPDLTVLFDQYDLEEVHCFKDPGMIASYWSRLSGAESSLVYFETPRNRDLPRRVNGVALRPLRSCFARARSPRVRRLRALAALTFLLTHARRIGALNLYHYTRHSAVLGILYKRLNPGGFLYLKTDQGFHELTKHGAFLPRAASAATRCVNGWIERALARDVDLLSVETMQSLEWTRAHRPDLAAKMILLPNGADDAGIRAAIPRPRSFREKEDLIIAVGRIGAPEKNHGLLLDALARIRLGAWSVALVGPIEEGFLPVIERFRAARPDLAPRVTFTGAVQDRRALYDLYDRAKVFCLTSTRENFTLAAAEAAYFGDVVITTPTGAARDLTRDGTIGTILPGSSPDDLARALEDVVEGRTDLEPRSDALAALARERFVWSAIVRHLVGEVALRRRRAGFRAAGAVVPAAPAADPGA